MPASVPSERARGGAAREGKTVGEKGGGGALSVVRLGYTCGSIVCAAACVSVRIRFVWEGCRQWWWCCCCCCCCWALHLSGP